MAFPTTSCLQLFWSPTRWRSRWPLLPGGGFLYHIFLRLLWSPTPDFLSSPSYIIVQSPTQSLEWHVWSSSSGNNCHEVHRSLSSGASVYECTMGIYLVPYFQLSPPTRFLLITAIGMCDFIPVHHFGMACFAWSKVNIQQFVCTQFKWNISIRPIDKTVLGARVDLGTIARKGYSSFPKRLHYWSVTIWLFHVISRTFVGRCLSPRRCFLQAPQNFKNFKKKERKEGNNEERIKSIQ